MENLLLIFAKNIGIEYELDLWFGNKDYVHFKFKSNNQIMNNLHSINLNDFSISNSHKFNEKQVAVLRETIKFIRLNSNSINLFSNHQIDSYEFIKSLEHSRSETTEIDLKRLVNQIVTLEAKRKGIEKMFQERIRITTFSHGLNITFPKIDLPYYSRDVAIYLAQKDVIVKLHTADKTIQIYWQLNSYFNNFINEIRDSKLYLFVRSDEFQKLCRDAHQYHFELNHLRDKVFSTLSHLNQIDYEMIRNKCLQLNVIEK